MFDEPLLYKDLTPGDLIWTGEMFALCFSVERSKGETIVWFFHNGKIKQVVRADHHQSKELFIVG